MTALGENGITVNFVIIIKAVGGVGSRVKISSWAYMIEFFLPNLMVLVSSKNSKYFSRKRTKRARENPIFGPNN